MPPPSLSSLSPTLFLILARTKKKNKLSSHLSTQSFVLTLSERLRIQSVDLDSFKSISSLSSPSPKLGAHLREDLGETLVCAFEVAYLVALGDSCDCIFLITLSDCHHLDGW